MGSWVERLKEERLRALNRREIKPGTGIEQLRQADLGELASAHIVSMPRETSAKPRTTFGNSVRSRSARARRL